MCVSSAVPDCAALWPARSLRDQRRRRGSDQLATAMVHLSKSKATMLLFFGAPTLLPAGGKCN